MTGAPAAEHSPSARHGLPVRFAVTLVMNVLRMAMLFVAGVILARRLGPAAYGDMNFLLGTFAAALPLLEMGTSSAFYTMMAQRRQPSSFYVYYAGWLALQLLLQLLAVAVLFPDSLVRTIWLNNGTGAILLALAASFASLQLWPAFQQVGEAARETVFVQFLKAGIGALYVGLILLLIRADMLNVNYALAAMALSYLLPGLYFLFRFDWRLAADPAVPAEPFRALVGKYAAYCGPLLLSSAAGAAYLFADKWLLQYLGGAAQQGYFSVGAQFAAVALLGTTSFINIFWKETAHAHASGDGARAERLFLKSVKSLYFVSCAIACFLIPVAPRLITSVFGAGYEAGWVSFAIMLFFPAHQTIGQIAGTYFLATERTRDYFRISVLGMLLGVPAAYFLLAPSSAALPGLGLGAAGLAVKSVLLQVFLVNLQGWLICRYNGWRWPLLHQLMSPLLLLAAGFACRFILPAGTLSAWALGAWLGGTGLLFCALAGLTLWAWPGLAGLTGSEAGRYLRDIRAWLGKGESHG